MTSIIEEFTAIFIRFPSVLLDRLSPEERTTIASAVPALAHAIELERTSELPLHPRPIASPEQHTERSKEPE